MQLQFRNTSLKNGEKNPNFFYDIDVDNGGRLMNVFWVDVRCRDSYNYFGVRVTFDTMYLTNINDMQFVSFVGVNYQGQSVYELWVTFK